MRDYGKVAPTFWTRGTGKQLRGDADAQLLALYLVTCQASNVIGIFYLPIATMAYETGLPPARVEAALARLGAVAFASYDDETETVWIPNLAVHQIGESITPGDKRRTGLVLAEVKRAGKHRYLLDFWARYGEAYRLGPCPVVGMAPIEPDCHSTSSHQIRSVTDQKQEQGVRGNPAPTAADAAPSGSHEPSASAPPATAPGTIQLPLETGSVPAKSPEPDVAEVFAHWVAGWKQHVGGTRTPALNDKRRGKIRARLREGFTVADLKRSIDGMWANGWNVENHHTDIELVCRDEAHVQRYLAKHREAFPAAARFASLPPAERDDDEPTEPADEDPLADLLASDLNRPPLREPKKQIPDHHEGHAE